MSASFPTIIETVAYTVFSLIQDIQSSSITTTKVVAVRMGEVFYCFKITAVILSRTLKYSSSAHLWLEQVRSLALQIEKELIRITMSASFPTIIETVAYTVFSLIQDIQSSSITTTKVVAVRMGEVFYCFKITAVILSRTLKYSSYYHTFKERVLEEQFELLIPVISPKQVSPYMGSCPNSKFL